MRKTAVLSIGCLLALTACADNRGDLITTQQDVNTHLKRGLDSLHTLGPGGDPTSAAQELAKAAEPEKFRTFSLLAGISQESVQGDAIAQAALALLYLEGQGVEMDAARAVELYLRSALQGNPAAQATLGLLYEHGNGVSPDRAQAFAWFALAAAQHNEDGKQALERLTPQMTGDEKREGKDLDIQLEQQIQDAQDQKTTP